MSDVIVVGAGPTGLTLAALLGRYGVDVTVLERFAEIYPRPRAVHLDDEVHRILLQVGIGAEFAAISRPGLGLRLLSRRHRTLATFTRGATPAGLPQASMFDQPDLERLLRDNLTAYPHVRLLSGVSVTGVGADGTVFTSSAGTLRAAYVIGCDGANSVVRESLGIGWTDLGFTQRWLVVDVRTDADLHAWEGVHQVCSGYRSGTYMRIGADRYRWEFQLRPGESASDYGDLGRLRPLIGPWLSEVDDSQLTLLRSSEYTFRGRIADRWRVGRVFLAGDAAHTTPPFIGQGMGAGQRDAANLAWKLAAALRAASNDRAALGAVSDGRAAASGAVSDYRGADAQRGRENIVDGSDAARHSRGDVWDGGDAALLDSYEAERRPHTITIIREAIWLGRVMTSGNPLAAIARRTVMPALSRTSLLPSRTAALKPGPLIDRRLPHRVRGQLLPLLPLNGVLVDELLGDGPAVVALPGVDPALTAEAPTRLTVDGPLADWLKRAGVDWVRVDPDRVVRAAGLTAAQPGR